MRWHLDVNILMYVEAKHLPHCKTLLKGVVKIKNILYMLQKFFSDMTRGC